MSRLRSVYRSMLVARCVDEVEAEMTSGGEAFFHVSGCGTRRLGHSQPKPHPGRLAASALPRQSPDAGARRPAGDVLPQPLCNGASHSAGRQMSAHMSDPTRRILSTVGPVGNNALQAVGVASAIKSSPERPIVVCSMGDGTTQQGEVLEAIAEAVRSELPVLFWIEDNALAISTNTRGRTFYSLPEWCGKAENNSTVFPFIGSTAATSFRARDAWSRSLARSGRPAAPGIAVFEVDRLSRSHQFR